MTRYKYICQKQHGSQYEQNYPSQVRRIRTRRRRYWRFKELPRNGNLDDSAHDGNLLDNVIDTDTNEVAKLRMVPSISIIFAV
jgi:hypothetical protein